ncbi:hypothetical protein A2Y85_05070 [candidate division WOR-3 bacterium RBG_13_43_14]|uniref:DUF5667 domain-containing protein n=1 Tax=candidate division WOR-3 bacterium RBG_13_43_14 TaxID=1802590 RepID=A0A1F4U898_UNCW3|nr:MAG: hypothetical protein A2Y85_05070 [candidate division WOR-3 bacterium RBG_13_43_14]
MKLLIIIAALSLCMVNLTFATDDPGELVEKVRIYKLTKELDLTTEQAVVFFPKLNEFHKIEKKFNEEKIAILHELKDLVKQNVDDKKINEVLERYEHAHRRKLEDQINKTKEMWAVLTVTQRAKFLIFQDEFNREIREIIKQIKKQQGND